MAVVACLWCEISLKPGTVTCPECGLQCPTGEPKTTPVKGRSERAARRGWRAALALVVAPLMLSAAYAECGGHLTLDPIGKATSVTEADLLQPPAVYADPLQRSVWVNGVKAVQRILAQPAYTQFTGSYIDVAAGHVVSFCGEVAGTSGYDSASGSQRFVSVFGQTQSTQLEGNDPSFDVLWERVCVQDDSPA